MPNRTNNSDSESAAVIVDRRVGLYWERIALGLISFVVTVMFLAYQGHQSDFRDLQTRVLDLTMDKVSKKDLSEVENRISNNFDARISELRQASAADKQDILQRLDLIISRKLAQ